MAYTVKNLSEISGVTIRTLHFYEEIGLLKPAYYGANGYRYYEERELLQLQQILFFKELGLTLQQIHKILGKSEFDLMGALRSHRKALNNEREKIARLLKTIDKTIKHLEGKKKMNDKEMFDGFKVALIQATKGQPYSEAEKIVFMSVRNPVQNDQDFQRRGGASYYQNIIDTVHPIFKELADCITDAWEAGSSKVQLIIQKHHEFTNQHHRASQEVYKAMAQLYAEHPEFRKQLDPFHPKLAAFLSEAMEIFADRNLS